MVFISFFLELYRFLFVATLYVCLLYDSVQCIWIVWGKVEFFGTIYFAFPNVVGSGKFVPSRIFRPFDVRLWLDAHHAINVHRIGQIKVGKGHLR